VATSVVETSPIQPTPLQLSGGTALGLNSMPHTPPEETPSTSAQKLGVDYFETLSAFGTSTEFVSRIPIAFARRHGILGLAGQDGTLLLAMSSLRSWNQLDIVGRFLGRQVLPLFAPEKLIAAAINEAYQQQTGQAQQMIQKLDSGSLLEEVRRLSAREDLLDVSNRAPVIKLVNLILFEAVKSGASDVHVQPTESALVLRLRLDGMLFNAFELPKHVQEEVVGRLKVMGRMNIAEKRLAQDGRATVHVGDRTIDLRIASLPTSHGERVVVRLLDKSARLYQLPELGMDSGTLQRFRRLIGLEHGLILVTGPTGSGKSTTLYAALKEINCHEHNVLTLEDPIEYQLDGISQTQVSDKKGMTFASGLRNVLRQDPDVIMVGEIRDRETASMAIQSALTGHLVFSTLHTNDAATAVTRLLDLGTEAYLLASSLVGVLAQRLVRKICAECGKQADATAPDQAWLGAPARQVKLRRGEGCAACGRTGYRGRLGIFELMSVDESVRRCIQSCATASQIKVAAQKSGMRTLRDDGVTRVLGGITTIEEVERVTMRATEGDESATDGAANASYEAKQAAKGG
jgi:general secretion pathway protein E